MPSRNAPITCSANGISCETEYRCQTGKDGNAGIGYVDLLIRSDNELIGIENKLWAEIYEIDIKKLEFFKKIGFKTDATLREHYFHNGKYYNSHILSLLRKDYKYE